MTRYAVQAIKINTVYVPGTKGWTHNRKRKVDSQGADGAIHETLHTIVQAEGDADLTSLAMKTWMGILTGASSDIPMVALDGAAGLVMAAAKAASAAPGYAAGTVHHARTALNGLIYLSRVRWSLGQPAVITLKAMFFDGAGSPLGSQDPVAVTTVTLPTQQIAAEEFTCSALTLNAVAQGTVEAIDLSIEPKFGYDFNTGLTHPVDITGGGVRGPVEIRLEADITDLNLAEGTGAVAVTFTQQAQGGTLGTGTVAFTLNAGWSLEDPPSVQSGGPATRRIVVRPRYAGTTRPMTWATT